MNGFDLEYPARADHGVTRRDIVGGNEVEHIEVDQALVLLGSSFQSFRGGR